uniref:TonB-dependent receptor n=1 Tax=Caulobacter sp. (strain K31) TaxID=366602 RepID=B0T6M1_CAUSK
MTKALWLAASAMLVCPYVAGTALAQEAPPVKAAEPESARLDEVVVTAQKRAENVQTVPISIAAFSATQLTQAGVDDVLEITKIVPSFTSTRQANVSSVRLNIRGIGASAQTAVEPSVASFLDDVYVSRPGAVVGRFYDVESVEVLRGPQGTLFGRNASAGALSIHTKKPTDRFGGDLSVQAASFGSYEASGAVNIPIGDRAAVRIAGVGASTDGPWHTDIGDHDYGALDTIGGRATLRLKPTDQIDWILRADYLHLTGDAGSHNTVKSDTVTPAARANYLARLGITPYFDDQFSRTSNNFMVGDLDDHQYGLTSDLTWDVADGYSIRLIDAMRDWSSDQVAGDLAFSPRPLLLRNEIQASYSSSHELQFISPGDQLLGGRLSFVSGLYYFDETLTIDEKVTFTADTCNYIIRLAAPALQAACLASPLSPGAIANFAQKTRSYAAYGQVTYKLTNRLDLTLGARYTNDEKSGSFVQTNPNAAARVLRSIEATALAFKDDQITWRANLSWTPADDILVFANYATGFKSGGFNSGGGTPALTAATRPFGSETVDDYELGVKSTLFDRVLQLNATLFRTDVHDYQDRSFNGLSFLVRNAADLRQQGVEADFILRPFDGLRINGAVGYLDSKYLSYPGASGLPGFGGVQDLSGKRNNFSPEWQGAVGVQYDRDIAGGVGLTVRGDMTFVSDNNVGSVTDANPQMIQDGFALFSGRVTFTSPDRRYGLQIFGENLFDKGYYTYIFPNTLDNVLGLRDSTTGGTLMRGTLGTPRTVGVKLTVSF